MNVNNMTKYTVGILIGLVMVAGLVIPIVDDAQAHVGDRVTYTNSMNSTNHYHYDYVKEVKLTAEAGASNWTNIVVNGQDISVINDYMLAIISDGFSLQIGGSGQLSPTMATDPYEGAPGNFSISEQTLTIEFKNGHWTVTGGVSGVIYEGDYTWVVTYSENGRYIARNGNPTNFYNNGSPEDFILYGGIYTSGELDTYYAYGMGKLTTGVSNYDGSVSMINTKVDGTTDVYRCSTCSVTITEDEVSENYTPYRALVKETIYGHEDRGSNYVMIGIIPLLAIVCLVVFSAKAIRDRR